MTETIGHVSPAETREFGLVLVTRNTGALEHEMEIVIDLPETTVRLGTLSARFIAAALLREPSPVDRDLHLHVVRDGKQVGVVRMGKQPHMLLALRGLDALLLGQAIREVLP